MNTCPYCGSDLIELLGMDDGGGDYGEAVCETWDCHDCGQQFEGDCIGQAIDGNFPEEPDDLEERREAFGKALFEDANSHLDVGDIPF